MDKEDVPYFGVHQSYDITHTCVMGRATYRQDLTKDSQSECSHVFTGSNLYVEVIRPVARLECHLVISIGSGEPTISCVRVDLLCSYIPLIIHGAMYGAYLQGYIRRCLVEPYHRLRTRARETDERYICGGDI
jgi:hypothetical protein